MNALSDFPPLDPFPERQGMSLCLNVPNAFFGLRWDRGREYMKKGSRFRVPGSGLNKKYGLRLDMS